MGVKENKAMNDIIKQKVIEANKAYRAGNSILSDQEYDDLLESLKPTMPEDEYEAFVSTLNEGSIEKNVDGKVKHPFILGSMTKIKAEEPEEVKKWIGANIKSAMSISAKVDGISFRCEYRNGKLVLAATRGDGYFGVDSTSKVKYIKGIPTTLPNGFTGNIRGELVCFKEDFERVKGTYANPRNFVAGVINRKDGDKKFNASELGLITFVPYTILGHDYTKVEQFKMLKEMGFRVADNIVVDKSRIDLNTINDVLFKITSTYVEELPYEVDGIILCDVDWINEDEKRPKYAVAYKQNLGVGVTTLIGIDWGTPSANGKFTPVGLLDPIQLCGTTVKRVTLNNITWMESMGVEIGKKVKILKSGEIIPKLIEVLN